MLNFLCYSYKQFCFIACDNCLISSVIVTTGAPRRIHVDSTSILRRYVEEQISTNFHVISMYFFRRNFGDRKIHVVSTYFFRCNFDGQKIHVVSTYFFRCNFSGRNIHVLSIMECVSMFLLIIFRRFFKLMKTFEEVFLCL